jgi:hypothetical protein
MRQAHATSSDHISFILSNPEASFRHVETAGGRDDVRYPRRFGEYILRSSFTALDPKPTSGVPAMSSCALGNLCKSELK